MGTSLYWKLRGMISCTRGEIKRESESKMFTVFLRSGQAAAQHGTWTSSCFIIVDGLSGSMKLWGYINPLFFVLLSMIDPSEEGCYDSLDMKKWQGKLTDNISLIRLDNLMDTVECTLETVCLQEKSLCHLLNECFYDDNRNFETLSEKCNGGALNTSEVHIFHFICLVAKAKDNYPLPGCGGYETVCSHHSEITPSPVYDQTTLSRTTGRPTTLPYTTTTTTVIPLSTTTLPETTAANPAALLMTATLQPTSTTRAAPQVTSRNADGSSSGYASMKAENSNLKVWLMVSVMLNGILPVGVYLYMRRQNRKRLNEMNKTSRPTTNMELKECANGRDLEAHLIQSVQ